MNDNIRWEVEYVVSVGPVGLEESRTHWRLDQAEAAIQDFQEKAEAVKRGGTQYASLSITHVPKRGEV